MHDRDAWSLGVAALAVVAVAAAGCGRRCGAGGGRRLGPRTPSVVAETSFLADIAQNVAGDRLQVSSVLPVGSDPHSFDPTPQDAAKVAKADAVVINSPGFEPPIDKLIAGAGERGPAGHRRLGRAARRGHRPAFLARPDGASSRMWTTSGLGSPAIDPAGADVYAANAAAYQQTLRELDAWIAARVADHPRGAQAAGDQPRELRPLRRAVRLHRGGDHPAERRERGGAVGARAWQNW